MKVYRGLGGSFCIVELAPNFERYIDAKKDVRHPTYVFIEYVRAGFVRKRDFCVIKNAPTVILELVKDIKKGMLL